MGKGENAFSPFSYNAFKNFLSQSGKNLGLFGKGLKKKGLYRFKIPKKNTEVTGVDKPSILLVQTKENLVFR